VAKRRKPKSGPPQRGHSGQGTDGVLELDRFSGSDLDRWNRLSQTLDALYNQLYFGFEAQRNTVRRELIEALQAAGSKPFDFHRWCRIVPHRFSLMPLSAAGSLRGVGGRFNVGVDIPGDVRSPWPALYIAADPETALREKYGLTGQSNGLTREELALTPWESHTVVMLNGHLEQVFDLTDLPLLAPLCKVLGKFRMPHGIDDSLRRLHIDRKKVSLVRTPSQLQRVVMAPNWRQWPVQFELPAHGQIFASIVVAAGYEAIRYRSSKSGEHCLAVFPQNFASSLSYIELADPAPPETKHVRLDLDSVVDCSGQTRAD
jgi:RES domain-containing protein